MPPFGSARLVGCYGLHRRAPDSIVAHLAEAPSSGEEPADPLLVATAPTRLFPWDGSDTGYEP